jgi:hypothetical protein
MKALYPVFFQRDFSEKLTNPAEKMIINPYSAKSIGGNDQLTITAFGNKQQLWALTDWLRVPVEIWDWRGEAVWWGFVKTVTVRIGNLEIGVSLDNMYNRVAVAYAEEGGSGKRATTSWVQDDTSVATFGKKELLYSQSYGNEQSANSLRDRILSERKNPQSKITVLPDVNGISATMECVGWWEALDWVYYSQPAGLEEYTDSGTGTQELGKSSSNQKVAQSFKSSLSWDAASIEISISKVNSPTDAIQIDLCSDSSGTPGIVLAHGQVPNSDIDSGSNMVKASLDVQVPISAGVTYWIVIYRSGSLDTSNCYRINCNEEAAYANGIFRIFNGTTWSPRDPNADMNFRVNGARENTMQMQDMVSASQFFTSFTVDQGSGIKSSQYRDGDTTIRTELESLLKTGKANGTRYLAAVSQARVIRVYQEPFYLEDDVDILMSSTGDLEGKLQTSILRHTCPVAAWVKLKDVIPNSSGSQFITDVGRFFIERAEYDPVSERLSPEPRGSDSTWDILGE